MLSALLKVSLAVICITHVLPAYSDPVEILVDKVEPRNGFEGMSIKSTSDIKTAVQLITQDLPENCKIILYMLLDSGRCYYLTEEQLSRMRRQMYHHISGTNESYQKVKVVFLSIWDESQMKYTPFIGENGLRMKTILQAIYKETTGQIAGRSDVTIVMSTLTAGNVPDNMKVDVPQDVRPFCAALNTSSERLHFINPENQPTEANIVEDNLIGDVEKP